MNLFTSFLKRKLSCRWPKPEPEITMSIADAKEESSREHLNKTRDDVIDAADKVLERNNRKISNGRY